MNDLRPVRAWRAPFLPTLASLATAAALTVALPARDPLGAQALAQRIAADSSPPVARLRTDRHVDAVTYLQPHLQRALADERACTDGIACASWGRVVFLHGVTFRIVRAGNSGRDMILRARAMQQMGRTATAVDFVQSTQLASAGEPNGLYHYIARHPAATLEVLETLDLGFRMDRRTASDWVMRGFTDQPLDWPLPRLPQVAALP